MLCRSFELSLYKYGSWEYYLVDRGVKMIMEEIPVSYEKASELLKKYGSVRNAVTNYQK